FLGLGLPLLVCGPNLAQFRIFAPNPATSPPGQGTTCALDGNAMYSEGVWGGNTYANLMVGQGHILSTTTWGGFDFCFPGALCNRADFGQMTVPPTLWAGLGLGYQVTGNWLLDLLPSSKTYSIRLHGTRFTDSGGGRPTDVNASQFKQWVDKANTVFAST